MQTALIQRISLVLLLFIGLCFNSTAQGIEFFKGNWDEALQQAKDQDKVIFVDGYAVWCGPCKRLSKSIFPLEAVGDYFNARFLNVKMDMEKGDGLKFRKKYPLSAFPTLYFIKPNGELIHAAKGAPRTGEALINLAQKALSKYDASEDFMKKYEAGARDYDTMFNLVKSLNKSGKSSLKYTNEYLRTQDKLDTEENLKFIYEGLTQLDSRVFDLFTQYKMDISKLYTKEEIQAKVDKAAWMSVNHALEYEYPELLEETQLKYAKLNPKGAGAFQIRSDLSYAIGSENYDAVATHMSQGIKAGVLSEAEFTNAIKFGVANQSENKKALKKIEKWCVSLIENHETIKNYLLLAEIQQTAGNKQAAAKTLDICIAKAKEAGKSADHYEEYKNKILSK
jgi:thiol-disulfide isomerase/thioredoxin